MFHPINKIINDKVDLSVLSASMEGKDFLYHESGLEDDFYGARSAGILVTRKDADLVVFYYYIYGMTPPNGP